VSKVFPTRSIGFAPGDVVSLDGHEHWLEGAWLLSELGMPVVALFFASDATLAVAAAPRTDLLRLEVCELLVTAAPFYLEHEGTRFERERRLPVELTSFGVAPELLADQALFLEYRALGGDALLVLSSDTWSWAGRGSRADKSHLERWGTRV
jgi:hypothetical protein